MLVDLTVRPSGSLVPEAALAKCIRELPDCVVLRNEEELFANIRRGGDLDLLVADPARAERTLLHHLGPPVRISRRSYVTGYFYEWGHVDLLPSVEWRGARYLQADVIVGQRRVSAAGRSVPRLAHEAVISWLTSLLWGGFFKKRYAAVIRRAVEFDGEAFRQSLLDAAGRTWGERLWLLAAQGSPESSARWARSLRSVIWWRACFTSRGRTIRHWMKFVVCELRLRHRPTVPWVAILGSDGSGKSSVINELVARYAECPYATVRVFHWRPGLVQRRGGGTGPVTDPHGKPNRGRIGSAMSLLFLTVDWLVGYWGKLAGLRAKGAILAFDRMYLDLLVDPRRYRYGANSRLARACWRLLPKPDLVFFLDVAPEVLLSRKREVSHEELVRQRQAYTALLQDIPGGRIVNGALPVNAIADEMCDVIRAWMSARTAAHLSHSSGGVARRHLE
jgi:thymidylate kinase